MIDYLSTKLDNRVFRITLSAIGVLFVLAVFIGGYLHQAQRSVKLDANARVECRDGHKWIRNVRGELIEWVNQDGSKPTCK